MMLILAGLAASGKLYFSRPPHEEAFVPRRTLKLVMLQNPGDHSSELPYWCADLIAQELGAEVHLHPNPLPIPRSAFHHQSGQANAVTLVEIVETLVTPECAVLGLTEYDLHSPLRRDLLFAMGARKGLAGLISTYRMEDRTDQSNTQLRLRKMLLRYSAEIVCDTPRNRNPHSILYQELQRPEQLDLMIWPPQEQESSEP